MNLLDLERGVLNLLSRNFTRRNKLFKQLKIRYFTSSNTITEKAPVAFAKKFQNVHINHFFFIFQSFLRNFSA